MLVLSRKVGQELVIGDSIRITVNRVGGSRVTLGISAPEEVRIVRGELTPIVTAFEGDTATPSEAAREDGEIRDSLHCSGWEEGESQPTLQFRPQVH